MIGRRLRAALIGSLISCTAWASTDDAKGYLGTRHIIGIADYANVSSVSDAKAKKRLAAIC
jgi:hypothetical protein